MSAPKVIVMAGGGGVGKTTSSAALGVALAEQGRKTLVITVDPARRLGQALGIQLSAEVQTVTTFGDGRLYALMPDPAQSSRQFLEAMFGNMSAAIERVDKNPLYGALSSGLAGMHEMVSLMLLARAVETHQFEVVIVDTAPSRHALDFVGYPARIAGLFEGKAVAWFASLAPNAKGQNVDDAPPPGKGLLAWGRRKVEGLVGHMVGPKIVEAVTGLFGELLTVRERFSTLARQAEQLLLGPNTKYVIVTTPSSSGVADALFIAEHLRVLGRRANVLLINRGDLAVPPWLEAPSWPGVPSDDLVRAVDLARDERRTIVQAADRVETTLDALMPDVRRVRVSTVDAHEPAAVVRALGTLLADEARSLAG